MPEERPWPADKIERWKIGRITPYAGNARTHSEAQIGQIVASIKEWGWTTPLLVDETGALIAGHARWAAARKLGVAEVPVVVARGWTKAQQRAYVLADNKLTINAGWDDDLLRLELGALQLDGFSLALTGWSDDELADILADRTLGLTDPDDVPDLQDAAVSQHGDCWLLGRHRLVCGDATSEVDVSRALGGVRPHLMVTDPPYGVEYDANWRNRAMRADGSAVGGRAIGRVRNDDQADWRLAWALFPGSVAYVWHGGLHGTEVASSLAACRFRLRAQIIWVKTRPVISRGDYHWQHEPLFHAVQDGADDHWRFVEEHAVADYAVRDGSPGRYAGGRKQSTVWFIEHLKSDTGHSTQKPVECMKRPIENNSSHGQAVYDPFVGSGTTLIAAEMTGRACHAIELSPVYVDVAVRRWQAFTGQSAVLEASGQSFAAVAAERRPVEIT